MTSPGRLLYIEPSARTCDEPVIDELTCKMAGAFLACVVPTPSQWFTSFHRSFHTCACGATSSNRDHLLPNGMETNFLCVHYLAYHRDEVPFEQLEAVRALDAPEVTPNTHLLQSPSYVKRYREGG